jgi:hypothetical protein
MNLRDRFLLFSHHTRERLVDIRTRIVTDPERLAKDIDYDIALLGQRLNQKIGFNPATLVDNVLDLATFGRYSAWSEKLDRYMNDGSTQHERWAEITADRARELQRAETRREQSIDSPDLDQR